MRQCPGCQIRIEKVDGCASVTCTRCGLSFCWACMRLSNEHFRWYFVCPGLDFSICKNILATVVFLIFLPLIVTIGPLILTISSAFILPEMFNIHGECGNTIYFCYALSLICYLPLALAITAILVALVVPIAIILLYILTIIYLVHLIKLSRKTKF